MIFDGSCCLRSNIELFQAEIKIADNAETKFYSLTAVVCHINDPGAPDKKNLVALIKARNSYTINANEKDHKWYLFNDVGICPVPAQEAVWFSLDWKIPCVLYYSTIEVRNAVSEVSVAITKVFNLMPHDLAIDYFIVVIILGSI